MSAEVLILLFARSPVAGQVKTRLAPAIGARGAATVHAALLERTIAVIQASRWQRAEVWTSMPAPHGAAWSWPPGWTVRLQAGEDLGERMHGAMLDALRRYERVILLGSDCPSVTPSLLDDAVHSLAESPLVLAPAEDGGYMLIGARGGVDPSLFDGLRWGADDVLELTVQRAEAAGVEPTLLPVQWDVDRPEDLSRLLATARRSDEVQLHRLVELLERADF